MSYQYVDNYPRKEIFDFFSNVSNPFYMVSFKLDITKLHEFVKANGLSFYYTMIYFINTALNRTSAFRYCLKDGKLALLDKRDPSFTDIRKNEECFYIVTMPFVDDVFEFNRLAKEKSAKQKCFIDYASECDDLVYYSCLPEVNLTALTNEFNHTDDLKNDSVPRIAWGRFQKIHGKVEITISMEVNHRFIDGLHISSFIKELERGIEKL